jgi:hypothetical protein
MSTILPELERQLHEAAVRRAPRRRPTRLAAPALAAAAVVVVAVVLAGRGGDPEREARPGTVAPPVRPLADAYAAFAVAGTVVAEPDPAALPVTILPDPAATPTPTPAPGDDVRAVPERGVPALDLRRTVRAWPLYERDGMRIAAWIGSAPADGAETVCFPHWERGRPAGGDCRPIAAIADASRNPIVVRLGHDDAGYHLTLLVPDRVTGLAAHVEGGASRDVPIAGNVALLRSPVAPCRVTWSAPGGGSEQRLPWPGGCA